MGVTAEKSADATAIRPLTGEIPQADLDDLRARIVATRWPEKETVEDLSQGVQLATMQALARYWADEYDWRKCGGDWTPYRTSSPEIDGLDIHLMQLRAAGPSRPTRTSSTSTKSTEVATSPPGSSRSCSPPSSARASAR